MYLITDHNEVIQSEGKRLITTENEYIMGEEFLKRIIKKFKSIMYLRLVNCIDFAQPPDHEISNNVLPSASSLCIHSKGITFIFGIISISVFIIL